MRHNDRYSRFKFSNTDHVFYRSDLTDERTLFGADLKGNLVKASIEAQMPQMNSMDEGVNWHICGGYTCSKMNDLDISHVPNSYKRPLLFTIFKL